MTEETYATEGEKIRLKGFLASLREQGRREATLNSYRQDWKRFSIWYEQTNGEPFDISRLTALDVSDFRGYSLREGYSPATINRRLVFLKRYCRYAYERGEGIRKEIYESIKNIPYVRKQALAPKALNTREVGRLLKELKLRGNLRDKAIIYTLLYTGLRLGELVHLRIEDIELSPRKGTILVRGEHAKGGKERKIPIPLKARKMLNAYLEERNKTEGRLFAGQRGPLGKDGVEKVVKKYADFARIKVWPHLLRHTFSYNYLEQNNNDLVGLANILGHESLNTTQIYVQKTLKALQENVKSTKGSNGKR